MEPLNESGIKHRLFGKNNSTTTHWYPRHGVPVPVTELHINHVAAIIDLYEGEAVKFLTEHICAPSVKLRLTEFDKRRAPIVDRFLRKRVPAWNALKNREMNEKLLNYPNWVKLFVNREYRVKQTSAASTKSEPFTPFFDMVAGAVEKKVFDVETTPMPNAEFKPFQEYWNGPKLSAEQKGRLNLKVTETKVKINTALNELQDWIGKNL